MVLPLALCLTALLLTGCGIGTTDSIFDYGEAALREVERHVRAWEPVSSDRSDELARAYSADGANNLVTRYAEKGCYEWVNGPRLQRIATDRAGKNYTIIAMDLGLDSGKVEPHWFVVPEDCGALYEYDPVRRQMIPLDTAELLQRRPKMGTEAVPEMNLDAMQRGRLSHLLNRETEVQSWLPIRMRLDLLLSSSIRPDQSVYHLEMARYMDGYYLPKQSLSQFRSEMISSQDGEMSFQLSTALFEQDGVRVQRWFLIPGERGGALYEYLPEQGRLLKLLCQDGVGISSFVREKTGLGKEWTLTCRGTIYNRLTGERVIEVRASYQYGGTGRTFQVADDCSRIYEAHGYGEENWTEVWSR